MNLSKEHLQYLVCVSLTCATVGCGVKKQPDAAESMPQSAGVVEAGASQEASVVSQPEEQRVALGEAVYNRGIGTFSSGKDTCIFRRYDVGTGRVFEDIVALPVACPSTWSMAFTEDESKIIIDANGFWLVNVAEQTTQLLNSESGPSYGNAAWKGGLPTVVYEVEPSQEEDVLMAEEFEATRGLPLLFCQESVFNDGQWKPTGETFTLEPSDGVEPECPAADRDTQRRVNNHKSQFDSSCEPKAEASEMEEINAFLNTEAMETQWCWGASNEAGTIAVGYVWNEGMHLTGQIVGRDGQNWVALEHVNSPVRDIAQLVTGTYICTADGYGMFNSDDATNIYWRNAPCLGLENP